MTRRNRLGQPREGKGQDTPASGLAGVVFGDLLVGLDGAGIRRPAGVGVGLLLHAPEPKRLTAELIRSDTSGVNGE
jgi:hypothetical protein